MHNRSYMCGNAFLASLLCPNLGILERLEIKEHQASCIFAVFLRKKIKVVLDIEPRCLSVRINRNEPATSSIAVRECMLYKIQNCPTNTLVVVIFRNSKTTYFHRGVGLAAFVIRNSAINSIPKRTFFGVIRDLIIQKTEISNSLLCLPIYKQISDRHKIPKIVLGVIEQEIVQVSIIAVKWQDFSIFAKGQKIK